MTRIETARSRRGDNSGLWQESAVATGRTRPFVQRRRSVSGVTIIYLASLVFAALWLAPDWQGSGARPDVASADPISADFTLCDSSNHVNCVVDGDTFWFAGVKYRIADIDTPETHPPRCSVEAALGAQATERLASLLNAGPFSLESGERTSDRYGRALRVVKRNGVSIGDRLITEGLARPWSGHRDPWC